MWPGLEELLATGARKGSILLVDDLQGVREILCWVLEREGYRVRTASDGRLRGGYRLPAHSF